MKATLERVLRSPVLLAIGVAVAGLVFPLAAIWIALEHSTENFSGLVQLHLDDWMLLVIDLAPIALGLTAYIAAVRMQRTRMRIDALQRHADCSGHNLGEIMETCFDAMITTGPGGLIENWNSAAEALFGYSRGEIIGLPLHTIDPPEARNGPRSVLSQASREQERCIVENEFVSKSGQRIHCAASVGVLRTDTGKATGLLAIVRDVTHSKQFERALIRARDAAESANEAKSRFLANMSHEIRTPMNGIIGMTQVLMDTKLDHQQSDYVKTLYASAEQLSFIINDILDLSKLEADKLTIERKQFDIRRLVQTTTSIFQTTTNTQELEFNIQLSKDLPEAIIGDFHRIKQILINLLNNAVKFTDRGTITVRGRVARELHDEIVVAFEVEDTGVGMTKEQCNAIFAPFVQVDDSNTRAITGSGLGLSICKQLVERMNGEIGVHSKPGVGSTFWFTIPTQACEVEYSDLDPLEITASVDATAGMKVLLVEDNAVNQKVAIAMLRSLHCYTDIAANGQEAVDAMMHKRYDVVLMDVQMPVMDGFEATKQIRETSPFADVPIIAMTARAMREDRDQCLAAGMDDHVPKPINKELLRRKMARWRGFAGTSEDQSAGSLPPTEHFAVSPESPQPASAKVRPGPQKQIEQPKIAQAQAAKAAAPQQPDTAEPDTAIPDVATADLSVDLPPLDDAIEDMPAATPLQADYSLSLNPDSLQALLSSTGEEGPAIVRDIIEEFLNYVPDECQQLAEAARAGNANRLRELSHTMRSSTGNLGVYVMYEQCSELEDLARDGDVADAVERVSAIIAEFDRAQNALEAWMSENLDAPAAGATAA